MRKKIIYLILVLCIVPGIVSAQIQTVQYWFDVNFAARQTLSPTVGQTINLTELNVTGLSEGIHIVHIRAKDNTNWSVVYSQMFYKLPATASEVGMVSYEYWVDSDYAGRKTGTLSGSSAAISELNVASYSEGVHILHIRGKDALGRVSVVHSQVFYKMPAATTGAGMTAYEYWVDNDFAGRKTGTLSGQTATISNLVTDNFGEGIHTLHIRAKDEFGRYSVVHSQVFYKLPASIGDNEITLYEYWLDNNFSNRKAVTATGKTLVINSGIDMNQLPEGFHTMCIRAKDKQGRWSVVHMQPFYVNSLTPESGNKIVSYRYWYDYDFAGQTQVTLSEPVDPYALKQKWVLPTTFNDGEKHTFHIQFRDITGKWSVAVTDTFKVVPLFSNEEFAALKEFYQSTNGDQWLNTQADEDAWNLNSIASVNDWKGISIKDGRTAGISLTGNNLTGTIPAAIITGLPHLKSLQVDSNSIEGLAAALPSALQLNIKAQYIDQGEIGLGQDQNLVVNLKAISCYKHSSGIFTENNRFEMRVNDVYKTRIYAVDGSVTIPKSFMTSVQVGDELTLIQLTGDAVGTVYRSLVESKGTSTGIGKDVSGVVSLYPNPTQGMVFIQEKANDMFVELYSPAGELLYVTYENELNLSGFNSGIYLIKVGDKVMKLVKQ